MANNISKPQLWTGSFIKICLVNFFIFVNFHALLPTFPFFIEYLGGGAIAIGLATALFSISSILSRPFIGWLVDSKGRCCILVIGLIGMSAIPLGYFASAGIALAVLLRTIHGAFHAASSNASSTWVTDIIPAKRMGEGLGMYGLSMAVSTAVAPAVGLAIMHSSGGFGMLFAMASVVTVTALIIGVSIKPHDYRLSDKPLKIRELFESMSLPAAITQFFFMMAYGVIEVYVAKYASENNLPSGGIYFIGIAVATVATRILLGRAVDKYGEARMVYTGNAAIITGILLLVFFHNLPCYLLSAALLGYSFGAIQPSLQTMAMHAVPPERRGAASSTFFVAFDFGIALGGFLAGVLIDLYGYDCMFLSMVAACIMSLAYYYRFGRRHASSFNPKNRLATAATAPGCAATRSAAIPFVITISREYGSGGHQIGKMLADRLGIPFYDKQLITLTATKSGISEADVKDSEQKVSGNIIYDNATENAMFHTSSQVIRDIAGHSPCVIVGRLANFVLKDRPNCLHIFIYADENYRTNRVIKESGVNASEAKALIRQSDQDRRNHCLHFTGQEWGGRHNYHILADSSKENPEKIVGMIVSIISTDK